ncbi:hypothetical protein PQR71_18080 [Paraburkholderia fungorum]|uniref:hypothetical protein n=1 Tax=Paraburkholderia fungorum TaxID=134537 RepID=UPI0038B72E83
MTFREKIEHQALMARREMVRSKELLTSGEFRERLGVSEGRLARMISAGSVFSIDVDDVQYFPALLTDPSVDRRRLQSVCRILVPAPPDCRLGYLSSRRSNLGGITPLAAMAEGESYRHLRQMARAYAAEWSRTSVKIYADLSEPAKTEPMYVAVCEIDPRVNLWKRAIEAMDAGGYIAPSGPYPALEKATVSILRTEAGHADETQEAQMDVNIVDGVARVVIRSRGADRDPDAFSVDGTDSIVDVVRRVMIGLRRTQSRKQGRKKGD